MPTAQIAVRLPDELLNQLDDLVAKRAGIGAITELERRRKTDRAVVEGYQRIPLTTTEKDAAVASLREAIVEESW